MVYSGANVPLGFQGPISLRPTMEKVQPWPQQGQNKGQRPELLLRIKAESFRAHMVCRRPRELLDLHDHVLPGERTHKQMGGRVGRERERMFLCSPGVITRSFFKITDLVPKLPWAYDGSTTLVRLTGLWGQAPPPLPPNSPVLEGAQCPWGGAYVPWWQSPGVRE